MQYIFCKGNDKHLAKGLNIFHKGLSFIASKQFIEILSFSCYMLFINYKWVSFWNVKLQKKKKKKKKKNKRIIVVLYRYPETLLPIKCMANIGIERLCTTLKRSWWEVDMYS